VTAPSDEILIVSDLHLAAPVGGAPMEARVGDRARALASFIRWSGGEGRSGAPPQRSTRRLVLLGDSLDLPTHGSGSGRDAVPRWGAAAADAVARIADAHPDPFDALAEFVAAGGRLELLPGNHDVALQLPMVRQALMDRVGGATGAVGWHPWIFHVPGLLWAEHGGQHHDVHAIPTWLSPPATRSTWGLPLGHAIDDLARAARRRPRPIWEVAVAAASLAADAIASAVSRPALAHSRGAYRVRELPACAVDLELPDSLLVAIDRLSETDGWSIAARLIRRRLAGGDRSPASFLGPAARRIHTILAGGNHDVRVYAFGHTHAPAVLPLGASTPGAWYANAGSWAGTLRSAASSRIGPVRYPFLRIRTAEGSEPAIELGSWNAVRKEAEPFPD
jgi:hypothetical protein